MIKKLSSMMLMVLCGAMLTATLHSAEESAEKEHAPIGIRSESVEARKAQLQARAKMAALNPEETAESSKQDAANTNAKSMKSMKMAAPIAAKSLFYTTHPGAYQNPVAVSFYGETVELMDGSIWAIAPSEAFRTTQWFPTDVVVITPNHAWFSAYSFRLTNQNTGESVPANMSLGPIAPMYGSVYTHWIAIIDYYYNVVYLEDGSIWDMSTFDSGVVNQWIAGDIVIIGVNDGWLSSSKPNVLINVNMLNFAAGVASF